MHRTNRSRFAAMSVAMGATACLLAGCGADDPPPEVVEEPDSITVTDASGREFTFDEPPKIGTLWYGAMLTLADLEVAPHAAIATKQDLASPMTFPGAAPQVLVDGVDWDNVEAWAGAEVEVVLAGGPADPGYDAIEAVAPVMLLNVPPWYDGNGAGIEGLKQNVRILGDLTGEADAAEEAVARFDRLVAAIADAAPSDAADRVVALLQHNEEGLYYVAGGADPFCEALILAEAGHCPDGVVDGEINQEAFLAADPDWIAYSVHGTNATHTDRDDPIWDRLNAVQDGNVYDSDAYSYSDSLRIVEFLLQEYAAETFGSGSGIEDPGPFAEANPALSPLTQ